MAAILRIVEKMLRIPSEMRFDEVVRVLEYLGWEHKRTKGSHFAYYKEGRCIIVVKHKNRIKRAYIKRIVVELNLEEWYERNKK